MLRFISSATFSSKHNTLSQEKKQSPFKELKVRPQSENGTPINVPQTQKSKWFVHLVLFIDFNVIRHIFVIFIV